MKKHLYHLLVFSLLGIFAASCSDDDDAPNIQSEIVGEWRLTSWSESAPEGFEVYVESLRQRRSDFIRRSKRRTTLNTPGVIRLTDPG